MTDSPLACRRFYISFRRFAYSPNQASSLWTRCYYSSRWVTVWVRIPECPGILRHFFFFFCLCRVPILRSSWSLSASIRAMSTTTRLSRQECSSQMHRRSIRIDGATWCLDGCTPFVMSMWMPVTRTREYHPLRCSRVRRTKKRVFDAKNAGCINRLSSPKNLHLSHSRSVILLVLVCMNWKMSDLI